MTTTTYGDQCGNLLVELHRYAAQQDEDFTTAAFAHLLTYLLRCEPSIFVLQLNSLTGKGLEVREEDCADIEITVQDSAPEGITDIRVVSPDFAVVVEVKVAASLEPTQLARYRKILESSGRSRTCLVLLTRVPVDVKGEQPDCSIRWYQVADSLERDLKQGILQQSHVTTYLVHQFLDFLRGSGMTMEQVGWELVPGAHSLISLMDMLNEAVRSGEAKKIERTGGFESSAYMFTIQATKCWSGIYYSSPQLLRFEAYNIDKRQAENFGSDRIRQDKATFTWTDELDLGSEDVHFFALSKSHQREAIERFIRRNIENVKKIGTSQGPNPLGAAAPGS